MRGLIHETLIVRMGVGEPNDEGAGARIAERIVRTRGRFSAISVNELRSATQVLGDVRAVWTGDANVEIDTRDILEGVGLQGALGGQWNVVAVQPTAIGQRVYLSRPVGPEPT